MKRPSNKKLLLILSLFLIFMIIGTATAADDSISETKDDVLTVDNSTVSEDLVSTDISDENSELLLNNDDNSENSLKETNYDCSFNDLQNDINNAKNNLVLEHDYLYDPYYDTNINGVVINQNNFEIDGQGHTINGNQLSRIFIIKGNDVTLKNINLINAYFENQFTVTGDNNYCEGYNGACIEWIGENAKLINAKMTNALIYNDVLFKDNINADCKYVIGNGIVAFYGKNVQIQNTQITNNKIISLFDKDSNYNANKEYVLGNGVSIFFNNTVSNIKLQDSIISNNQKVYYTALGNDDYCQDIFFYATNGTVDFNGGKYTSSYGVTRFLNEVSGQINFNSNFTDSNSGIGTIAYFTGDVNADVIFNGNYSRNHASEMGGIVYFSKSVNGDVTFDGIFEQNGGTHGGGIAYFASDANGKINFNGDFKNTQSHDTGCIAFFNDINNYLEIKGNYSNSLISGIDDNSALIHVNNIEGDVSFIGNFEDNNASSFLAYCNNIKGNLLLNGTFKNNTGSNNYALINVNSLDNTHLIDEGTYSDNNFVAVIGIPTKMVVNPAFNIIPYGSNYDFTVTLSNNIKSNFTVIYVSINGTEYNNYVLNDNKVSVSIPNLEIGTYNIEVTYKGNTSNALLPVTQNLLNIIVYDSVDPTYHYDNFTELQKIFDNSKSNTTIFLNGKYRAQNGEKRLEIRTDNVNELIIDGQNSTIIDANNLVNALMVYGPKKVTIKNILITHSNGPAVRPIGVSEVILDANFTNCVGSILETASDNIMDSVTIKGFYENNTGLNHVILAARADKIIFNGTFNNNHADYHSVLFDNNKVKELYIYGNYNNNYLSNPGQKGLLIWFTSSSNTIKTLVINGTFINNYDGDLFRLGANNDLDIDVHSIFINNTGALLDLDKFKDCNINSDVDSNNLGTFDSNKALFNLINGNNLIIGGEYSNNGQLTPSQDGLFSGYAVNNTELYGNYINNTAYYSPIIHIRGESGNYTLNGTFINNTGSRGLIQVSKPINNATLVGNYTNNTCRIALINDNVDNVIFDGNFDNNFAIEGTVVSSSANAKINNLTMKGNYTNNIAHTKGAVSSLASVDSLTVDDTVLENNTAILTAGIGLTSGNSVVINNTKVNNNSAIMSSGISIGNANNVTVDNTNFTQNTAIKGAGLITSGDNVVVQNSNFNDNEAVVGAGIMSSGDNLTVKDSEFNNNEAVVGAGIMSSGDNLTVKDSEFNNNVGDTGVGIMSTGNGANIEDSKFVNNSGRFASGILTSGDNTTISNSDFINNTASKSGAAIVSTGGDAKISESNFTGNSAHDGSVIELNGDKSNFEGNNLTDNNASGIVISGDDSTFNNNLVDNNTGDAVTLNGDNVVVERNNIASNGGVGLTINGNDSNVKDNNIASNGGDVLIGGESNMNTPENMEKLSEDNNNVTVLGKSALNVTVSPEVIHVDENITLTISITPGAGTIRVTVNNKVYNLTVNSTGVVICNLGEYAVGDYNITVEVIPNPEFTADISVIPVHVQNWNFTELQDLIDNAVNGTVDLDGHTFVREADEDAIKINDTVKVNGEDAIIDANGKDGAFDITADGVELNNMTITDVNGTAINAVADNFTADAINLTNNNGTGINVIGNNSNIENIIGNNQTGDLIKVLGDNATVSKVSVNGGEETAVNVTGNNAEVSNIDLYNHDGEGVVINGNNATVGPINAINGTSPALTVNGNNTNVTDVALVNQNGTGVIINGDNNNVTGTVANGGNGTSVSVKGNNNKVEDTTGNDHEGTLVAVDGNENAVAGTTSNDGNGTAVNVKGNNNKVENTAGNDHEGTLVAVDGNENTVANATANGGNGTAVDVKNGNNNTINGVNSTGNHTGADLVDNGNGTKKSAVKPANPDTAFDLSKANADPAVFTINLPSDATGNFTVSVGGKDYTAKVVNGTATVSVPGLASGDQSVVVSYSGDGQYSPIFKTATVTIPKPDVPDKKATVITAKNKVTFKKSKRSKTKTFKLTLKEKIGGKKLSGKTVLFKLTNVNKIKLTKKVKKAIKKANAKVKKARKAVNKAKGKKAKAKAKKKLAKAKKAYKKALKPKTMLKQLKEGKYAVKTNKNGVAKLTLSKNSFIMKKFKGKNIKLTAKFNGDSSYLKSGKTVKVVIK